jgi:hypothetical protein
MALGVTADPEVSARAVRDTLADPAGRAAVKAAIAAQATHFDLLGLQLGHTYGGALVIDDGATPAALDDPARDYAPSTRPGGRLPHGWLDAETSTLDLVDPTVVTVLVRDGAVPPTLSARVPTLTRAVDAEVWDETFGLAREVCLVVRPDQHVAARGPITEANGAIERLFSARTECS